MQTSSHMTEASRMTLDTITRALQTKQHPIWAFLEKAPLNAGQFSRFRDDYLYMTQNTAACIASYYSNLIREENYEVLSLIMDNLTDETARGTPHALLMYEAFNILAGKLGVARVDRVREVTPSHSARCFQVVQNEVFRSSKIGFQTGFYLAHEMHADVMLRTVGKQFILHDITHKYFIEHSGEHFTGGVEEHHYTDGYKVCVKLGLSADEILEAVRYYDHIRSRVWDTMLHDLVAAGGNSGDRAKFSASRPDR